MLEFAVYTRRGLQTKLTALLVFKYTSLQNCWTYVTHKVENHKAKSEAGDIVSDPITDKLPRKLVVQDELTSVQYWL